MLQRTKKTILRFLAFVGTIIFMFAAALGLSSCAEGTAGVDGIGVSSAYINDNGELVITYSDGSSQVVGSVVGSAGTNGTNGTNGADGADGVDGKDGADGTSIAIASIVENKDADGNVVSTTITFSDGNSIIIANGVDGEDGSDGADGEDGTSVSIRSVAQNKDANGNVVSTTINFTDGKAITIANGVDGEDGADGTSVTITSIVENEDEDGKVVSTTITFSDGNSITVTNGVAGEEGKSAYELAVENGYTGTVTEWLAALVGENGADGADGKSAYELAVEKGYTGTEDEWLASLVGADGTDGADGADGKSAYELAVENGYPGTLSEWLTSLIGEDGLDGSDGLSAYELAVENGYNGTVTEWLASLVGADGVDGTDGTDGKSAYELAVENGYTGTVQDWLISLVGADGANGKSAYDVAVENGFVGTEEEWLESLKGADGVDGQDGSTWFSGSYEAMANVEAKKGDFYLSTDDYSIYTYTDGAWVAVTSTCEHDWYVYTVETGDGSCESVTYVFKGCKICGEVEFEVIPGEGHTYESTYVDPKCTVDGFTADICIICGNIDESTRVWDEGTALGHDYVETDRKDATCTEDGYVTYVCSRCNNEYTETIAATGHKYNDEGYYVLLNGYGTICEDGGFYAYICENCNEVVVEPIDALGHDVEEWSVTKVPTTEEEGEIQGICSRCGKTVTVVLPELNKTDYAYTAGTKESCKDATVDTYVYTYEGATFEFTVDIPAGNHASNGTELADDVIYDLDKYYDSEHTYAELIQVAGNSNACGDGNGNRLVGTGYFICSECGEVIVVSVYVPHTYDSEAWTVVTPATCTEAGVETNVCTVCGMTVERDIPATGHTYSYVLKEDANGDYLLDSNGNYIAILVCKVCGAVDEESEIAVTNVETTVITEATCDEVGYEIIKITLPDDAGTETLLVEIPALGHSYNGVVIPEGVIVYIGSDEAYYYNSDNEKIVIYDAEALANGVAAIKLSGNSGASCNGTAGTAYYLCDNDGDVIVISAITDHTKGTVVEVVAATCEEQGYTTYVCSVCGNEFVADYTQATGHSYSYFLSENADGSYTVTYVCDNDATHAGTIEASEVTSEVTTKPTCTKAGVRTYTVTYTDKDGNEATLTYTEEEPIIGHTLNGISLDDETIYYLGDGIAYYYNNGEMVYIYNAADGDVTEIKLSGNSNAGCAESDTSYGTGYFVCEDCGMVIIVSVKTAHEYDEGVVMVEATATTEGTILYTCGVCGDTYTEVIAPTGYNYTYVVVNNDGVLTVTLTDEENNDEVVLTLDATMYEAVVTVGNCTVTSSTLYTYTYEYVIYCTSDDYTFEVEIEYTEGGDVSDHDYVTDVNGDEIVYHWTYTNSEGVSIYYEAKLCKVCNQMIVQSATEVTVAE